MHFFTGLNESYSHTRAQLLLMNPSSSINKAFSLVNQKEQQRSISASLLNTTASSIHMVVQHSRNVNKSHLKQKTQISFHFFSFFVFFFCQKTKMPLLTPTIRINIYFFPFLETNNKWVLRTAHLSAIFHLLRYLKNHMVREFSFLLHQAFSCMPYLVTTSIF